ncbi:MAG: tetratricopeptide repeat protein [Phycisphaerae bacterium]|nr:tetratricopeptide repeat protein [Phycisphaerae bacterium]
MRKPARLSPFAGRIMALIAALALANGVASGSEKKSKTGDSGHGKAASSSSGHGAKAPAKASTTKASTAKTGAAKAATASTHGSSSGHGSSVAAGASQQKAKASGTSHGSSAAGTAGHGEPAKPASAATDPGHNATTTAPAEVLTGAEILKRLAEGNARFATGKSQHPNADAIRRAVTASQGQKPIATVVACSDSRVPVEILFDEGIGDLFVVRVAGNVCDTDEIGSIEYGTEHLETPLLLILGHTRCGAVTAVAKRDKIGGSIPQLVDNIARAVAAAEKAHPDLQGDALVAEAVKANVLQSIEDLLKSSEIVRHLASSGRLKIEGAIYDLEKGTIQWLGKHPAEKGLLAASGPGHKTKPAAEPQNHAPAAPQSPITRPGDLHADAETHAGRSVSDSQAAPSTQPSLEMAASSQPAHVVATVAPAGHASATQPHKESLSAPRTDEPKVLGWTPTTRPANGRSLAADHVPVPAIDATPATRPAVASSGVMPTASAPLRKPSQSVPPVAAQPVRPGLLERTIAEELYRQGAAHLIRGEDTAAAERFSAALETDPNLLPALNDLAGICYLRRDYNKALELYSKVLATEPSDESALRGSALTYASQKRYAESRNILQRLLARNAHDGQTWMDFGDVLYLLGDTEGALNAWRQAVQVNPSAASLVAKASQRLRRFE